MADTEDGLGSLEEFESLLGVRFRNRDLLRNALTHSSAKAPESPCNERLEFLGDSVLGLVIAEQLYRTHAGFTEGDLTQVKSVVVSSRILARVGSDLGFERFVLLGKGIQRRQGVPPSLVAGTVEAVIGAVFLDQGLEESRRLVLRWLEAHIEAVLEDRDRPNFKSLLQNYSQKALGFTPTYRVVSERGPAHGRLFEVEAVVGRRAFPPGAGRNKKDAEQAAAEIALAALAEDSPGGPPASLEDSAWPLPWAGFEPGEPEPAPGEEDGTEPAAPEAAADRAPPLPGAEAPAEPVSGRDEPGPDPSGPRP